jgi:hypothetical protein
MSIAGLVKRIVKGAPLTAAEHDANLTAIEGAVQSHAANHQAGGQDTLNNVAAVAPALTADANDWALPVGDVIEVSANAPRSVTGLAAGFSGKALLLVNTGIHAITLKHEASQSAAANRLRVPSQADYIVPASGGAAVVVWLASQNRWMVI